MGQSSTAQDSMLRKGSGYVLDGEDGHDPPNRLHTFCPITHLSTALSRKREVRAEMTKGS